MSRRTPKQEEIALWRRRWKRTQYSKIVTSPQGILYEITVWAYKYKYTVSVSRIQINSSKLSVTNRYVYDGRLVNNKDHWTIQAKKAAAMSRDIFFFIKHLGLNHDHN